MDGRKRLVFRLYIFVLMECLKFIRILGRKGHFYFLYFIYVMLHKSSIAYRRFLFCEILLCLLCLAMLRYAGLIYFFLVAFFMIYWWNRAKYKLCRQVLVGLFLSSLLTLGYLSINYIKTGFYTGGMRYYPELESYRHFIILLGRGVENEVIPICIIWL